jgi:hypothetical protein
LPAFGSSSGEAVQFLSDGLLYDAPRVGGEVVILGFSLSRYSQDPNGLRIPELHLGD